MTDDVYRPDETGEFLEAEDGSRIVVTPHLYFADNDPILSFTNSGISFDTKYDFYRAVRLDRDLLVEGVSYKKDSWQKTVQTDGTVLEQGSMLVRTFGAAAETGKPAWFALSWNQQRLQNMQRQEYVEASGSVGVVTEFGKSCSQGHLDVESIVKRWDDKAQAAAHIADRNARTDEYYRREGAVRLGPGHWSFPLEGIAAFNRRPAR